MLRLLAILITYHLSLITVSAQVGDHRSDFAVGLSGGYMLSSVGFTPRVPQNQHTGMTGGISMRYTSEKYFNSICAIVAELNYAQIGWKEKITTMEDEPLINSVTGLAEAYQRDLNYLQVPVMARMGWGRERKGVQFFVQAGPQIGVMLSENTVKNYDVSERVQGAQAQDSMSVEHKFDYGIAGGLGLEFSHPKVGHFILEGRYYYGLGDIYGNSKRDFFARSNFQNVTVKLTYLFDIQKTKNYKIK